MPVFQSETVTVERDQDGTAMLRIDVPGRTVNVVTRQMLSDLSRALDFMAAEKFPVMVIYSGKSTGFLAGADLKDFQEVRTSAAAEALSAEGQRLYARLAALPTPSIASISGACLGGGLELAMACDYRLVFDAPATQLGLPERDLGLLPAWGGTQRLPRIVGLERALSVILGGKRLKAQEALAWGLADAVGTSADDLKRRFAALKARAMQEGKQQPHKLPVRTWRQRFLEWNPFGRRMLFNAASRRLRARVPDDMPAPAEALEAVRVGVKTGGEAGFTQERQAAGRLALTPACRNLIGVFFGNEKARKIPDRLSADDTRVQRVGVVGAGVMGAGIAQLALLKGCEVVVQEIDETALGAGLVRIQELFQKAVQRKVLTEAEARNRLSQVRGSVTWKGFDSVDLVVEAAIEDLARKKDLFRALEAHCRPDTVLATNTSSLRVVDLQQGLSHPERVAGLHFFNPVHKMPLVEVVRAPQTADAALARAARWAVVLGKTPVLVRDAPGFVVNRILAPYLDEAVRLVAEGLGTAALDGVMRKFGMPVGPLELLDQIGLDVAAHVVASMTLVLAGRFPPNEGFARLRQSGWLGQKSGRGFYDHRDDRARPNPLAENLLRAGQTGTQLTGALSASARLAEARERMVLLMVNEAVLVLDEGLTEDAGTLDLAMVLGTGWAPHRGGPLHYADDRGVAEVVRALEGLAARHGPRFEPAAGLRRQATTSGRFTKASGSD
jgi:3-hydroxyacyl-CoA dehydrogenase/enoyl-CoA hydratase/3-hydroxybutyryl-CoA epimerase